MDNNINILKQAKQDIFNALDGIIKSYNMRGISYSTLKKYYKKKKNFDDILEDIRNKSIHLFDEELEYKKFTNELLMDMLDDRIAYDKDKNKNKKKINEMKHLKLFEDWDENVKPLSKGEKLVNTVESHGLSVNDKVIIGSFKYGSSNLTNVKGTIKQIRLTYVNESPQYHYNIHFDVPIGVEKQIKRDHWMFGPYGVKPLTNIKKI